jgi:hypothetical protein
MFNKILTLSLILVLAFSFSADARPRKQFSKRQNQNSEIRQEMIQFVKEYFPDRGAKLERLASENPAEFRQRRNDLVGEIRRLIDLQDRDPELFEIHIKEIQLRHKLEDLGAIYQDADPEERKNLDIELRELLHNAFDIRQQIKAAELEDLRKKLKHVENGLENRIKRRDELIEQRFNEITRNQDSDW